MEKITGTDKSNISLTELKKGEKARIVNLITDDPVKLRKLYAFGILPDNDIIILQKYPAVVIQIGFTQVALDNEVASNITVSRI